MKDNEKNKRILSDDDIIRNDKVRHDPDRVTYIGETDFRGVRKRFGIKNKDRTRHTYIIGKTGMGKSTVLENMAIQDIINGEGVCFIDPHGSSAEKLLSFVPENRLQDVIYFNPSDMKYPLSLNVLEYADEEGRHLVASGLMNTFKKIFADQFSGRMSYLLNNAILSLLENKGESLLGINRIFIDKEYRKHIISNVKDPAVKAYWEEEFTKYTDKYIQEAAPAIQNKIGQFISNPLIRNIIGQDVNSFDLRKIMDERKILICNLSVGLTGKDNVDLIGSLLVTKIYLAALSRANLNYEELQKAPPFYLYVDEFQNFVNESFADILSQARKYNLGLTVAHQYIEQLDEATRASIFGNVGSIIVFRVGAVDAEYIEKEFAPTFTADDIVNLASREIVLRLSIDNISSKPFSAWTLKPIENENMDNKNAIINLSRALYGRPKFMIEENIRAWYRPVRERLRSEEGQDSMAVIKQKINDDILEKKFLDKNNPVRERINSHLHTPKQNNNTNTKSESVSKKLLNIVTELPRTETPNRDIRPANVKGNFVLRDALISAGAINHNKDSNTHKNNQDNHHNHKNNQNNQENKRQNTNTNNSQNTNNQDKIADNTPNIKEVEKSDIDKILNDIM